jgi:hypothetical protein
MRAMGTDRRRVGLTRLQQDIDAVISGWKWCLGFMAANRVRVRVAQ